MRWWHQSPLSREAGSEVVGRVTLRSPPLKGGRIRSCNTHGVTEALPIRGARSGTVEHMALQSPPL
jgi:hypothetical protein